MSVPASSAEAEKPVAQAAAEEQFATTTAPTSPSTVSTTFMPTSAVEAEKPAPSPPPPSAIMSSDTDKIFVPEVQMGQYPTDPSQQHPQAPIYPDHTGSTSPYQQVGFVHPDPYAQSPPPQQGYDQSQHYAHQTPQPMSDQQQHPAMVSPQASGGPQFRTATALVMLNRSPAPVDCPACGVRAVTSTNFVSGNTTHAWAFGTCLCLCLGCIPYLIKGTKNVEHKCSNCGVLLATWHRSGSTDVHVHA